MVKLSLAPMLDVTKPNFCNLIKIISPHVELFSEMYVDHTVIHAPNDKLDRYFSDYPKETIIQLGGSDPARISTSIQKLIQRYNFTKFNLNCGCPSDRVQKGRFGAILMKEANLVCDIINKTYNLTGIILSIKCRIGIQDTSEYTKLKNIEWYSDDDYSNLYKFVACIYENTMCRLFYIHCRKCILSGLSPKDNRVIPPINYAFAHRIKADFPKIEIHINGGINCLEDFENLNNCDGIMIGRAVMNDPFFFEELNGCDNRVSRLEDVLCRYFDLFENEELVKSSHVKPIMNLCKGLNFRKKYVQLVDSFVMKKLDLKQAKDLLLSFLLSLKNKIHSN